MLLLYLILIRPRAFFGPMEKFTFSGNFFNFRKNTKSVFFLVSDPNSCNLKRIVENLIANFVPLCFVTPKPHIDNHLQRSYQCP